MLLVIFGAGASFDSVPQFPAANIHPAVRPPMQANHPDNDRPPLASQLFDTRPKFVSAMGRFPEMLEVVPLLRRPDVLVERELAVLRDQRERFPRAHKELAAVLFYLHFAIWECQKDWRQLHLGVNNYVTFVREIERWRLNANEHVCFVTFNYDTMLEEAMMQVLGVQYDNFDLYVSQAGYTVVKLHGSINWGHEVEDMSARSPQELIQRAANLEVCKEFRLVQQHPMVIAGTNVVGYPAISIPVERKDEFSCPERHVEALRGLLPQVTRIVAVGWRGMESDFLSMLRDGLKTEPELLVVSGDERGANETLANLKKYFCPLVETIVPQYGFTGLINNLDWLQSFLGAIRPANVRQ